MKWPNSDSKETPMFFKICSEICGNILQWDGSKLSLFSLASTGATSRQLTGPYGCVYTYRDTLEIRMNMCTDTPLECPMPLSWISYPRVLLRQILKCDMEIRMSRIFSLYKLAIALHTRVVFQWVYKTHLQAYANQLSLTEISPSYVCMKGDAPSLKISGMLLNIDL